MADANDFRNELEQAARELGTFLLDSAQVPVVFWFCWSDGMVPPFGILRTSGERKPAYGRYEILTPPW